MIISQWFWVVKWIKDDAFTAGNEAFKKLVFLANVGGFIDGLCVWTNALQ
jgi:hypothetical protein